MTRTPASTLRGPRRYGVGGFVAYDAVMPTLTVNLALDAPGSGAELDDDTPVKVQALNDVVRTVDDVTYTIEPFPLPVAMSGGIGTIDLAAGYYWVHHPWGSKLVSLEASARLDELPAIDPATLDPDEPMTPAWQAQLDAVSTATEQLDDRVTELEGASVELTDPSIAAAVGDETFAAFDAEGFARTDDIAAATAGLATDAELADAIATRQPAGNYQPAGDYVTDAELAAFDYATEDYVDDAVAGVGGGGGLVTYADAAAVAAVTTTELGIVRVADFAAFFGFTGGVVQSWSGGDVLIESTLSNNYSSSPLLPPAANGSLQQVASLNDGNGSLLKLRRHKLYASGAWGSFGAWVAIPIPTSRPAGDALWFAGAAAGTETWRNMASPVIATPEQNLEYVAQQWEVNFLADSMLESGRLVNKYASYAFEGILDGATVNTVGTLTHVPGVNTGTPTLTDADSRIEVEAASSAVGAIAGLHIPLNRFTRTGFMLHMVFGMRGGITADTRLLGGIVHTDDVAAAMADNDPATPMQNFGAFGYGSASAFVSGFSRATGGVTTRATTAAPSTNADQLLDLKIQGAPNGGAVRIILNVNTANTKVQTLSTLTAPTNAAALMSLFLRASAGATAAQPKVALYKLRVGLGLGLGGF